ICVNIHVNRSLSRPCSDTEAPFPLGSELCAARLVGSFEDLIDRQVPQLLREHLDAPRPVVARLPGGGDVRGDRELALAGEYPMVDGLVDEIGQALSASVGK